MDDFSEINPRLHSGKRNRRIQGIGLKDHQIARLASDVTKSLKQEFPKLPECLRQIVVTSIVVSLRNQGLAIDKKNESHS